MITFFIISLFLFIGFVLYKTYIFHKKSKLVEAEIQALVKFSSWYNRTGLLETREILLDQFMDYKKRTMLDWKDEK